MKKLLVNNAVKWWVLPKCKGTLHQNIRQFTTKDLNVTSAGKVSTKMLDSKITKMCIRVKSHTNVNFVMLVLRVVGPMQCTSEVILVIDVQNNIDNYILLECLKLVSLELNHFCHLCADHAKFEVLKLTSNIEIVFKF